MSSVPASGPPEVGFVLGSTFHSQDLITVAKHVESNGFRSIWTTEDYFATGGVAAAGIVLGATSEVRVGTGLLSVYARHPGLTAMEAAALASVHPGRFLLGLGVGGLGWLDQQGIPHRRPLGAVRGTVEAVRRLLAGEPLTGEFGGFAFDDVHLEFPPPEPPPIYVGATGPKMTALTGEIADGLILSVFSSPEFVRIERQIVAQAGQPDLPLTTFAFLIMGETNEQARELARPVLAAYLAGSEGQVMTDAIGATEQLRSIVDAGGEARLAREMPDAWIDHLAVCGDLDRCVEQIEALTEAGSNEVALAPIVTSSLLDDIERLGSAMRAG